MDSTNLTPEQAKKMHDVVAPTLGYLSRLQRRMGQRKFPPDDRLYQLVNEAQAIMQHLTMKLHYLSCESGARMSRKE